MSGSYRNITAAMYNASPKDWRYKIGSTYVEIRAKDDSTRFLPSIADVMGMTPSDVERAQWKRTIRVTPSDIAGWIGRQHQ